MIVIAVGLHEVHNIEAIGSIFPRIFYFEIVPLGVSLGAIVILEVEVVLVVADFDCFSQISRLETTLKEKGLVFFDGLLQLVEGLQCLVVAIEAGASLLLRLASTSGLFSGLHYPCTVARCLLQTVGQVHWVEVVALLIRLIYLVLILLVRRRKFYQVALVDVHIVGRAVVVRTRLNAVVDDG